MTIIMHILENILMPSSNHRSSSTHSSRRTQTDRRLPSSRSASVPHRQFVIVLTNNSELLRHTLALQPQVKQKESVQSVLAGFDILVI
jgi:hypothetical protein